MSLVSTKTLIPPLSVATARISPSGIAAVINSGIAITPTGETLIIVTSITRGLYSKLPVDDYTSRSTASSTYIDSDCVVQPRRFKTQIRGQVVPHVGQDQYSNSNGVLVIVRYNFKTLNVQNLLEIWMTNLDIVLKKHLTALFRIGQSMFKFGDLIVYNVGVPGAFEPMNLSAELVSSDTAMSSYVSTTLYNEANDSGTTLSITPSGTYVRECVPGINVFKIGVVYVSVKPSRGKYISNTNLFASLTPTLQEFYSMDGLECITLYKPMTVGTRSIKDLVSGKIVRTQFIGAVSLLRDYVTFSGPGVLYVETANITYRFSL